LDETAAWRVALHAAQLTRSNDMGNRLHNSVSRHHLRPLFLGSSLPKL
jgi:hypothetical protein